MKERERYRDSRRVEQDTKHDRGHIDTEPQTQPELLLLLWPVTETLFTLYATHGLCGQGQLLGQITVNQKVTRGAAERESEKEKTIKKLITKTNAK